MLVGLSQMRSTLMRDSVPFAQDLESLKSLVGDSDPELTAALERLAPQAAAGVLTPSGLSAQFAGVAGDVVSASLTGENVSIEDRAKARLNNVFQVEKDGQLITGTPAQATVSKTQRLLEQGDISGAINEMKMLQGPAASVAQPWISKAQGTLMAQQLQGMLTKTLGINNSYGVSGATINQNETSGAAGGRIYNRSGF